jgi:hypothetical protein
MFVRLTPPPLGPLSLSPEQITAKEKIITSFPALSYKGLKERKNRVDDNLPASIQLFFLDSAQTSEFDKDSWCLSLSVTEFIQSRAFSLCSIFHFCMKDIDRKTHTSGDVATGLLKMTSFLINQRLQAKQPNKNTK